MGRNRVGGRIDCVDVVLVTHLPPRANRIRQPSDLAVGYVGPRANGSREPLRYGATTRRAAINSRTVSVRPGRSPFQRRNRVWGRGPDYLDGAGLPVVQGRIQKIGSVTRRHDDGTPSVVRQVAGKLLRPLAADTAEGRIVIGEQ